MQHIMLIDCH